MNKKEKITGIRKITKSGQIRYYYPEKMKQHSAKFTEKVKNQGKKKFTCPFLPEELINDFLNCRERFGTWESFLTDIVKKYN